MWRTELLAKACPAFFLRESGCSDSSSTFHLVDIHYTHGRWCCRGSSSLKSAVSFLERLRSTSFTSAARAQNTVSSPILGHALGNCLSPQGRKKEKNPDLLYFMSTCPVLPNLSHDSTWRQCTPTLNYTSVDSEDCHSWRFFNPAFWFYIKIFTKNNSWFPGERFVHGVRLGVCVCACVLVPHSHSYASASYQGPLCLIEPRSCFPFISQMQWKVILLVPNKTYQTGPAAFTNFH